MILIVGGNHDDVLYYETLAREPKEEIILGKYHAISGSIFNQNVLILKDVYTSFVSASLCMHIIEKYHVIMVFCVGKCRAISEALRCGDIVLSKRVVFGDVDMIGAVKGTKLGQIPGYPTSYYTNPNLLSILTSSLERLGKTRTYECTFLSSSIYTLDYTSIDRFLETDEIKGEGGEIAIDGETAGVALAAHLLDVPFISAKVIESKSGEEPSVDTYLRVLKQYSTLGKAIVSSIGEIGRNDILRQGEILWQKTKVNVH